METWQPDMELLLSINPGITEAKLINLKASAAYHYAQYAKQYEEEILWDDETGKAGMVDKVCLRTARGSVVDIFDYKTNIEKGIYFDSIKKENGIWKKHYNRYYSAPFDHIEQCNYFEYCLQLSTYGLMAEKLGYKVGKLQILFIDFDLNLVPIPVPYMRKEAEIVLGNRTEVNLDKNLVLTIADEAEEDW